MRSLFLNKPCGSIITLIYWKWHWGAKKIASVSPTIFPCLLLWTPTTTSGHLGSRNKRRKATQKNFLPFSTHCLKKIFLCWFFAWSLVEMLLLILDIRENTVSVHKIMHRNTLNNINFHYRDSVKLSKI